jgi:hypothetical protein
VAYVTTAAIGALIRVNYATLLMGNAPSVNVKLPIPWADVTIHRNGRITVINSSVRCMALERQLEATDG